MPRNDGDAWFAPKRYGYGTGLPVRWQGWVATISYVALITFGAFLIPYSWPAYALLALAATAAMIAICAQRTRGGWRWRWGERD